MKRYFLIVSSLFAITLCNCTGIHHDVLVSVRVLDSITGVPVSKAKVVLTEYVYNNSTGGGDDPLDTFYTDGNGYCFFTFRADISEHYSIIALKPPYYALSRQDYEIKNVKSNGTIIFKLQPAVTLKCHTIEVDSIPGAYLFIVFGASKSIGYSHKDSTFFLNDLYSANDERLIWGTLQFQRKDSILHIKPLDTASMTIYY